MSRCDFEDTGSSCSTYTQDRCPLARCVSDDTTGLCRDRECTDYFEAISCAAANCKFESSIQYCYKDGPIPCVRYSTEQLVRVQKKKKKRRTRNKKTRRSSRRRSKKKKKQEEEERRRRRSRRRRKKERRRRKKKETQRDDTVEMHKINRPLFPSFPPPPLSSLFSLFSLLFFSLSPFSFFFSLSLFSSLHSFIW